MDGPSPAHPASAIVAARRAVRDVLAAEPSVRFAWLFGSAAAGKSFHDLDVGVVLQPGSLRGIAFGALISRLEQATGIPVELLDLDAAAPSVRAEVVRLGFLLVDREPPARREWEVRATGAWLDLRPSLERQAELRRRALLEQVP